MRKHATVVAALCLVLASSGCIDKIPNNQPDSPEKPGGGSSSTEINTQQYTYPYGSEVQQFTAVLTLTLDPEAATPTAVSATIPPLKYDKKLLLLHSQDDCVQTAFSTTWAAIHGRPLSDTYYYSALQLQNNDLPPESYGFGKTLGSTDGAGNEVRFSFTTTLSPEWSYMEDLPTIKPGYTDNYYRFFMKRGLAWSDVIEMTNFGVGIAMHNVNTPTEQLVDSILVHYPIAQQLIGNHLSGRICKVLCEPDGNKNYISAAQQYAPLKIATLQSGGEKLIPSQVTGDLQGKLVLRSFWADKDWQRVVQESYAMPFETREAVCIGTHKTGRTWAEFLLWLNNTYGKEGDDSAWMTSIEEYYDYNDLRQHTAIQCKVIDRTVQITLTSPTLTDCYFPSLTLRVAGIDPEQCSGITANDSVTGLSWGGDSEGLLINIDCRKALLELATRYVERYESAMNSANRADAHYFVAQLKPSAAKEALLERIK